MEDPFTIWTPLNPFLLENEKYFFKANDSGTPLMRDIRMPCQFNSVAFLAFLERLGMLILKL